MLTTAEETDDALPPWGKALLQLGVAIVLSAILQTSVMLIMTAVKTTWFLYLGSVIASLLVCEWPAVPLFRARHLLAGAFFLALGSIGWLVSMFITSFLAAGAVSWI